MFALFEQQGDETMNMTFKDFIEAVLFGAFIVVSMWLYCRFTPAQMSGEYDLAEEAGRAYSSYPATADIHSVPPSTVKAY